MTGSDRWQRVKTLFNAARERPATDRASYLNEACGGDQMMLKEVESLLAAYESDKDFLSKPAYQFLAGMLAENKPQFETGQTIGPYKILSSLGAGGMGEVYLAQDTRLGRRVALKLLPALYTQHADRLRRFEQEARTASALNHPNIVTIYEIGESDSTHFIAAEFIEGITLRRHLANKSLPSGEALSIAMQVASALAAAHAKGVVHRDIKPENIMVLKEGYSLHGERHVKVLDFGIAKLTDPRTPETDALTRPMMITGQGVLLGTASYMSPEQARGLQVDARTDIWSLGVVLYEMLAGGLPFAGDTAEDVRAAILKDKLPPLSAVIPDRLKWIVEKSLRKDPDERYQTIREMFSDLRELHQQEIESEVMKERSIPPETVGGVARDLSSGQADLATTQHEATSTTGVVAPPTSSAEYIVSQMKRHKTGAVLTAALFLLATVATGLTLYKLFGRTGKYVPPFREMKIVRLTTSGNAAEAAISPDGKYVAYVLNDKAGETLWLRQIVTNGSVQIAPPAQHEYTGLIFSRDGNYLYYAVHNEASPLSVNDFSLYQVPVLGGATKRVLEHVSRSGSTVTFSPDGKRMAFVRFKTETKETSLFLADANGTGEQLLLSRREQNLVGSPTWSPDGKTLACGVADSAGYARVVGIQVVDGHERTLTSQHFASVEIERIAWLPDGQGLLLSARSQSSPFTQLWHISLPEGSARRLTNDLNHYVGVSLTADADALVSVQSYYVSNLWLAPLKDARRARQITSGFGQFYDLSWTLDGKIAYASDASGSADIWLKDPDDKRGKQLTANAGRNYAPTVTPDGRYIVFHSDRTGSWNLWRMNMDGSNQTRLVPGEWATVSPDGNWVIYNIYPHLWKTSIDGGEPLRFLDKPVINATISPNGQLIACQYKEQENNPWKVAIVSFDGGRLLKTFDIPIITQPGPSYRWTPDSHALVYLNNQGGVDNLWLQALDGSRPQRLTEFQSQAINSFDVARDAQLIISRGVTTSDVVLIQDIGRNEH